MNNTKINAQLFPNIITRSFTTYIMLFRKSRDCFSRVYLDLNLRDDYHAPNPHPHPHPMMANKMNNTKINAQLFPNIISTPFNLSTQFPELIYSMDILEFGFCFY